MIFIFVTFVICVCVYIYIVMVFMYVVYCNSNTHVLLKDDDAHRTEIMRFWVWTLDLLREDLREYHWAIIQLGNLSQSEGPK